MTRFLSDERRGMDGGRATDLRNSRFPCTFVYLLKLCEKITDRELHPFVDLEEGYDGVRKKQLRFCSRTEWRADIRGRGRVLDFIVK